MSAANPQIALLWSIGFRNDWKWSLLLERTRHKIGKSELMSNNMVIIVSLEPISYRVINAYNKLVVYEDDRKKNLRKDKRQRPNQLLGNDIGSERKKCNAR